MAETGARTGAQAGTQICPELVLGLTPLTFCSQACRFKISVFVSNSLHSLHSLIPTYLSRACIPISDVSQGTPMICRSVGLTALNQGK